MTERDEAALTWRQLLTETSDLLGEKVPACWLCETAAGREGDDFLAHLDEPATHKMVAHLDAMVTRYRGGEPLAYVLGHWSFRRIEVFVDARVLIPRPETEVVAGRAIELAADVPVQRRIVDLGTGSGIIGLSLAVELPLTGTEIWMTDASPAALDVARANASGLGRAAANVRIAQGSWFEALDANDLAGAIDVIVSNPPYVAAGDAEVLTSVVEWEPHEALFAGSDGLDDVRIIVSHAPTWLRPGGWLILEIGHTQGPAVRELFAAFGFVEITVGRDLAGRDRYVEGRRPQTIESD